METTFNYEFNKISLKDKAQVKPAIDNFINIEILINRIILNLNNSIQENNESLTKEKIDQAIDEVILSLEDTFKKDEELNTIIEEAKELLKNYSTLEHLNQEKQNIINQAESLYLKKNNDIYGLKTDLEECKKNEKKGRNLLSTTLTDIGIQTNQDESYTTIIQNIEKLQNVINNNDLVYENKLYEINDNGVVNVDLEYGGIAFFKLLNNIEKSYDEYFYYEINVDNRPDSKLRIVDERIVSGEKVAFFLKHQDIIVQSLMTVCMIDFNKSLRIKTDNIDDVNKTYVPMVILKRTKPSSVDTAIKTVKLKRIPETTKYEYTFTGKGFLRPLAVEWLTGQGQIDIYTDDVLSFSTIARPRWAEPPFKEEELKQMTELEKLILQDYQNILYEEIKKGFFYNKSLKIVINQIHKINSMPSSLELKYQQTPL